MKKWRIKTKHELDDDTGVITTYFCPQKRIFLFWVYIENPTYCGPYYYQFISEENAFNFIERRKELKKKKSRIISHRG